MSCPGTNLDNEVPELRLVIESKGPDRFCQEVALGWIAWLVM
jgi:hypothetical protein